MATKKTILYVCDRCSHEQDKPLPGQIKVLAGKAWKNWDLCTDCTQAFGDFLIDGVDAE